MTYEFQPGEMAEVVVSGHVAPVTVHHQDGKNARSYHVEDESGRWFIVSDAVLRPALPGPHVVEATSSTATIEVSPEEPGVRITGFEGREVVTVDLDLDAAIAHGRAVLALARVIQGREAR